MSKLKDKVSKDQEGSFENPLEKYTTKIGDNKYKIVPLKGSIGLSLWEDIMSKLLPSLGSGLDQMQYNEVLDGSPTTFSEALIHLSRKLDGDTFDTYSKILFEGATVNDKPLDIDSHFSCNYGEWKKLFVFSLKENFQSFFEEGWADSLKDIMIMASPLMQQGDTE